MKSPFWAVTCLYNPASYARRRHNYRVFRQHLNVPLVAVELSFDGSFELQPGDADILIQLQSSTVLWHKERLLNIAMSRLPAECRYVAWLDCDVVFGRDDWSEAAIETMRHSPVCQPFENVFQLLPDPERLAPEYSSKQHKSFGYAASMRFDIAPGQVADSEGCKRGFAWCARRDLLDRLQLYDRAVLGGGARYIAFGATGCHEKVIALHGLSTGYADDYRRWAVQFREAAEGRVGYAGGDLLHLWHGDIHDRRYDARQSIQRDYGYDPLVDIALDEHGCWRWDSDKPAMHEEIRQYFYSRLEDGRNGPSPPSLARAALAAK